MKAKERRIAILHKIQTQPSPITASALAEEFGVSRQVIVGDIALLRANHHDIIASNQGYFLPSASSQAASGYTGKIVCLHQGAQTRQELEIILHHHGKVLDVQVDHPIYGVLSAGLRIQTVDEMDSFLDKMHQYHGELLSSLTDGVHIHTIQTPTLIEFQRIQDDLDAAGILYH